MASQQKKAHKAGRHKVKCERYRASLRRWKNKMRRHERMRRRILKISGERAADAFSKNKPKAQHRQNYKRAS